MAEYFVNNEQNIVKESLKYFISEKETPRNLGKRAPKIDIWSPLKLYFQS